MVGSSALLVLIPPENAHSLQTPLSKRIIILNVAICRSLSFALQVSLIIITVLRSSIQTPPYAFAACEIIVLHWLPAEPCHLCLLTNR